MRNLLLAAALFLTVAPATLAGDVHQPPLVEPTPQTVVVEPDPPPAAEAAAEPGLVELFAAAVAGPVAFILLT